MAQSKNLWAKTRPTSNPYATVKVDGWEWKILKAYQTRKAEMSNAYARYFCSVTSPYTCGMADMGDTYVKDIPMTMELEGILNERLRQESEA